MSVTFLYDSTDATRFWFNELHRQLQLVQPRIQLSLKSCGDLEDENLDKTCQFLLVLSKKTSRLHKTFVNSLINHVGSKGNAFLVVETEENLHESFYNLSGTENTACVDDLLRSFKWLPKVLLFLFKLKKPCSSQQKQCVVPLVNHDHVSLALRKDLLASLLELGVKVSENSDNWFRGNICVILRNDNKGSLEMPISDKWGQHGMICVEYNLQLEDKNLITYSKSTQLLFLLYLLHQCGLVRIKSLNNKRIQHMDTRIDTSNMARSDSATSDQHMDTRIDTSSRATSDSETFDLQSLICSKKCCRCVLFVFCILLTIYICLVTPLLTEFL